MNALLPCYNRVFYVPPVPTCPVSQPVLSLVLCCWGGLSMAPSCLTSHSPRAFLTLDARPHRMEVIYDSVKCSEYTPCFPETSTRSRRASCSYEHRVACRITPLAQDFLVEHRNSASLTSGCFLPYEAASPPGLFSQHRQRLMIRTGDS